MKYRLMTAAPPGLYYELVQDRVDRTVLATGVPFTAAVAAHETSWLPVAQLLDETFRWPAYSAPTAWLDQTGLTWVYSREGDTLAPELKARLDDLKLPWFGLNEPCDGWLAVPINAVAAHPLSRPGPLVVTGDWLIRQDGGDRPCTDGGGRWSDGYEATTIDATSFGVTRAVAEQVVACRARQRRAAMQDLLDAGIAASTARQNVDARFSKLRWQGATLIHEVAVAGESDGRSTGDKITADGAVYALPRTWAWHVVDRELVDVVHGEH